MRRFLRQNFLILLLMNSGNVFSYLFQMVAGRAMTPDEFGGFNALNSFAVILTSPMGIVPLIMARFTAGFALEGQGRVKRLLVVSLKVAGLTGGAAVLVGLLAMPWLKDFLHLEGFGPLYVMLAMVGVSLVVPVPWGMLQGLQRFLGYGLSGAMSAFTRLLAGLTFLTWLGLGIPGGMACGLAGMVAQAGLALYFLKDVLAVPAEPLPKGFHSEVGRYSAGLVVSAVITMCLNNLDLVLVRHFCPGPEAGLYATAAILGRIAFYGPSVLVSVLFTEAATAKAQGQSGNKSLWMSMGLTIALGGGYALACLVGSDLVIKVLFGSKYVQAGGLLSILSLAMAMLAAANVLFAYFQARSEFGFMWVQGLGVGLFALLVYLNHDSAAVVAKMLLYSISLILAATLAWFFRKKRV